MKKKSYQRAQHCREKKKLLERILKCGICPFLLKTKNLSARSEGRERLACCQVRGLWSSEKEEEKEEDISPPPRAYMPRRAHRAFNCARTGSSQLRPSSTFPPPMIGEKERKKGRKIGPPGYSPIGHSEF